MEEKKKRFYRKEFYKYFEDISYKLYEKEFKEIVQFMKENEKFRTNHTRYYTQKIMYNPNLVENKIINYNQAFLELYIGSVKAVSQGKINNQYEGFNKLRKKLTKINPDPNKKINFKKLFENKSPFEYLASNNFKGLGNKTAALFIRDIHFTREELFEDFENFKPEYLKIPVDIVICIMLNKIFKLETNKIHKNNRFIAESDFNFINTFFKEKLGRDYMLVEDLWFWGYFNLKVDKDTRKFEFNEPKYEIDNHSYNNELIKEKIKEFQNKFMRYIK